jgi:hemophore-related protein
LATTPEDERMKKSATAMVCALGVAAAVITAPAANAAPCTASGLASTASGVLAEAGGFLEAHPGANDVLTAAATQPAEEAKAAVNGYFSANVGEYL